MKKLLALLLALCFLTVSASLAESADVALSSDDDPITVDAPIEFDPVNIMVETYAIGFQIPSDFIISELTAEQIAEGMVLSATDANQTYSLQVSIFQSDSNTFTQSLIDEGVQNLQTVFVNEIEYITYTVPSTNNNCAALFVNETQLLSFSFLVPAGAAVGTVPFEIMGSLFDL